MPLMVIGLAGCKTSQLQSARVIREDRNVVVVAMPENTSRFRDKALKLAEGKLGKDVTFVDGKDVETGDVIETEDIHRRRFRKGETRDGKSIHRHEYQVTFTAKRTTSG